MDAARVVVVVLDGLDALAALGAVAALVDGREGVEARVDGHEAAAARAGRVVAVPALDHAVAVRAEHVARVLAHGPLRRDAAARGAAGAHRLGLVALPLAPEEEEDQDPDDGGEGH